MSGEPPPMTAPLEAPADAAPETVLAGVGAKAIEGRSLGQIAWMRLRRDKVAIAGGIFILFLVLVAILRPHLGHDPTVYNSNPVDPTLSAPRRPVRRYRL